MATRFDFPDIADFPENDAPRNDSEFDVTYYEDIEGLARHVLEFGADSGILAAQLSRVRAAWKAYESLETDWGTPLARDGILSTTRDVSALRDVFKDDMATLWRADRSRKSIKEIDRVISRSDPEAIGVAEAFLDDLMEEVWNYRPVDIKSVNIQLAAPGDEHHYQTFADCDTVTKLLNLHVDPKPGVVKALIYLEIDDGPFQFVKGSNKWEYDDIQRIFAWGNSVGNYCHTPEHRKVANAFPSRYRRNAIVGRLIPDGTALSDLFLSQLTTYTTDNVMVFDPCFGFHRGGLCETGTRYTLQVVMK